MENTEDMGKRNTGLAFYAFWSSYCCRDWSVFTSPYIDLEQNK